MSFQINLCLSVVLFTISNKSTATSVVQRNEGMIDFFQFWVNCSRNNLGKSPIGRHDQFDKGFTVKSLLLHNSDNLHMWTKSSSNLTYQITTQYFFRGNDHCMGKDGLMEIMLKWQKTYTISCVYTLQSLIRTSSIDSRPENNNSPTELNFSSTGSDF